MIIKSTVRGNGGQLAHYLLNDKKNDRAELVEMRGWTAATLRNALRMSEAIAYGKTHCEKPFYHVSFRLVHGEELKPEQWEHCADKLEQRLGLDEHHRALVMHTYKGEKHLHVVWDRIDENTLKAVNLFQDRPKCKEVARELEKEFGLQRVRNEKREPERELAAPSREEEQQARRTGQDLKEIRAGIREAWEQSADGKSFAEALDERGLMLAQGDKRDYVALDEQGSVYSIGKRTTGATARAVREKLADLERERIPTVAQARADLLTREPEQKPEHAKEKAQEAVSLREEAQATPTQENAPERRAGGSMPTPDREAWDTTAHQTTAPERTPEPEPTHERHGWRVVDRESGLESSVSAFAGRALDTIATQAEGVIEGIASLFDGGRAAPQQRTAQEPPRAKKTTLQKLQEQAAKERALRNISKSVQRGDDLNAADLRALPRGELERLREGGDAYLKRLVQRYERERDDRGRERER